MDRADESRGAKRRRASSDTVLRPCLDSSDDEDAPTPSYEEWLGERAFGIYRAWRVGKGRPVWHAAAVTIQRRVRACKQLFRERLEDRLEWEMEWQREMAMEAAYDGEWEGPSFPTPPRSQTRTPSPIRENEYFQEFESKEDIDRLDRYRGSWEEWESPWEDEFRFPWEGR